MHQKLLQKTRGLLINLVRFAATLLLGIMVALLFILPWLLRIACFLVWLFGGYLTLQAVQHIYGPYSPIGPVLALQFGMIFLMVSWAGLLLKKSTANLWSGLAACGITTSLLAIYLIPWMLETWEEANFFFQALPPTLFAVGLIFLTIRLRILRTSASQTHISQLSNTGDTHEPTKTNQ